MGLAQKKQLSEEAEEEPKERDDPGAGDQARQGGGDRAGSLPGTGDPATWPSRCCQRA